MNFHRNVKLSNAASVLQVFRVINKIWGKVMEKWKTLTLSLEGRS